MTLPAGLVARTIFVDTSAFYSALNPRDALHANAVATFMSIVAESRLLVTSNLVVAETHTLILRRMGRDIAAGWLERMEDFNIVFETETDSEAAQGIIARYSDKNFSYADAVSFVLMERLGIGVAFAFDDDFRQYGLDVIP